MASQPVLVTIPNVSVSLDQILAAVRQLDISARSQVARALLDTELDAKLDGLIRRLAERRPADEISDAGIREELEDVRTVTTERQRTEVAQGESRSTEERGAFATF